MRIPVNLGHCEAYIHVSTMTITHSVKTKTVYIGLYLDLPSLTEFPWVSRNRTWPPGLTEMIPNLTEFGEFEWHYFFLQEIVTLAEFDKKLSFYTDEYHWMWRVKEDREKISATTEISAKFCYYPPPPHWIASAFGDHRKTQEIQQAQLGSSAITSTAFYLSAVITRIPISLKLGQQSVGSYDKPDLRRPN